MYIVQKTVEYLGVKISRDCIQTQERLVNAVNEWPIPKSIRVVLGFSGLSGYYRKFVKDYALITKPLTNIITSHKLYWNTEEQLSFQDLKEALTSAPALCIPRTDKTFTLFTDASAYAVGATLEQKGHPVAYLSHTLTDTEMRRHTGDQELLAFMIALRKWEVYLRGRSFIIKTDHKLIKYLQSKSQLSARQYKWLDEIKSFNFLTEHVVEQRNVVADAFSQRPDLQLR